MGNESIEGDERGPYLMLERIHPTECGIAYTLRDAWRQSFRRTRGSDDPPGSAGKRHTRGRKAGGPFQTSMELEGREMRKPFLILNATRWLSGKPSALKGACSVCAVRRVVVFLLEAGGMREDIPGLSVYLETKVEGNKAD